LNLNQKPSLKKEASSEEEALEKATKQNMQQGVNESPEEAVLEKATAQKNDIESEENTPLFPPPPDIREINSSNKKEFIAGLDYHGFDGNKLESLDENDLSEIEKILKESHNIDLDDRVTNLIREKINELYNKKNATASNINLYERKPKEKKTFGGRRTKHRPRKRR